MASSDLGSRISVQVSGSRSGFFPATTSSALSTQVAAASFITSVPVVLGSPVVGETLSASVADWDPVPDSYAYQWFVGGSAVDGATSSSYVVASSDGGSRISVQVSGSRSGYATVVLESLGTSEVPLSSFRAVGQAIVTGSDLVGEHLGASFEGQWEPTPGFVGWQWYRDGKQIEGAIFDSYETSDSDIGHEISVEATAYAQGFVSASEVSDGLLVKPILNFTQTPTPSISLPYVSPYDDGALLYGALLVAQAGTWDSGVVLSYQWLRNGETIQGANGSNYRTTSADIDRAITVKVTGTKPGYYPVAEVSDGVAITKQRTLSLAPIPTIQGIYSPGKVLSAVPGDWEEGVTLKYEWMNGLGNVIGTKSTLSLGDWNAGVAPRVRITGSKPGFKSESVVSEPTQGRQGWEWSRYPWISGSPTIGTQLYANWGIWKSCDGGSAGIYYYEWFVGDTRVNWGVLANSWTPRAEHSGGEVSVRITTKCRGAWNTVISTYIYESDHLRLETLPRQVLEPQPTILGDQTVGNGNTVTVDPGIWDAGVDLSYQWFRNGTAIEIQRRNQYTLSPYDIGNEVSVRVTGVKEGYENQVVWSESFTPTALERFRNTPVGRITGELSVGSVLEATHVEWDPAPSSYSYQWFRSGQIIGGATSSSYTVSSEDLTHQIYYQLTGIKPGYQTVRVQSDGPIVLGFLESTPVPTISAPGGFEVYKTVYADSGDWDAGVTLSYAWYRDGKYIPGQNSLEYLLTEADEGKSISVKVSGWKPWYNRVTVESEPQAVPVLLRFEVLPQMDLYCLEVIHFTPTDTGMPRRLETCRQPDYLAIEMVSTVPGVWYSPVRWYAAGGGVSVLGVGDAGLYGHYAYPISGAGQAVGEKNVVWAERTVYKTGYKTEVIRTEAIYPRG